MHRLWVNRILNTSHSLETRHRQLEPSWLGSEVCWALERWVTVSDLRCYSTTWGTIDISITSTIFFHWSIQEVLSSSNCQIFTAWKVLREILHIMTPTRRREQKRPLLWNDHTVRDRCFPQSKTLFFEFRKELEKVTSNLKNSERTTSPLTSELPRALARKSRSNLIELP